MRPAEVCKRQKIVMHPFETLKTPKRTTTVWEHARRRTSRRRLIPVYSLMSGCVCVKGGRHTLHLRTQRLQSIFTCHPPPIPSFGSCDTHNGHCRLGVVAIALGTQEISATRVSGAHARCCHMNIN